MNSFESLPASANPFEADLDAADQDDQLYYEQQLETPGQWTSLTQQILTEVTPPNLLAQQTYGQPLPAGSPYKRMAAETNIGEQMEQNFVHAFADTVAQLSVEDTAIIDPFKSRIAHLADYRFTPISPAKTLSGSSLKSPMTFINMPGNVKTHYNREGGVPYLDAEFAVGLVYRDVLAAVAAGGVDTESGALRIVQIQGVNTWQDPNGGRGARFKTGLHNGMAWRDTLVAAWVQVAAAMNAPKLEIQGAANNSWLSRVGEEKLQKNYDHVAARHGFTYNPVSQNWELAIGSRENQQPTES